MIEPKRFLTKPSVIEAVQWVTTHTPSDDAKPVVDWIKSKGGDALFLYDYDRNLQFRPTIRVDIHQALPNDWICLDQYGKWWVMNQFDFKDRAIPADQDLPNLDPNTPPQVGME